jgi:hypothetical protein
LISKLRRLGKSTTKESGARYGRRPRGGGGAT